MNDELCLDTSFLFISLDYLHIFLQTYGIIKWLLLLHREKKDNKEKNFHFNGIVKD